MGRGIFRGRIRSTLSEVVGRRDARLPEMENFHSILGTCPYRHHGPLGVHKHRVTYTTCI